MSNCKYVMKSRGRGDETSHAPLTMTTIDDDLDVRAGHKSSSSRLIPPTVTPDAKDSAICSALMLLGISPWCRHTFPYYAMADTTTASVKVKMGVSVSVCVGGWCALCSFILCCVLGAGRTVFVRCTSSHVGFL